ncbi:hypothetical protein R50073_19300 [Maricurvus nonylphenolicus]|uniref:hypothetical protein n=1 Tax=Maricurvus nonylphenolicus TaxID=1008307 RepID=UPI0036F366EC
MGYASGTIPQLPINLALVKGYSLVGVHWAGALIHQPDLTPTIVAEVMEFLRDGRYVPVVDSNLRLDQCLEGIDKMKNQQVMGKVVVSLS